MCAIPLLPGFLYFACILLSAPSEVLADAQENAPSAVLSQCCQIEQPPTLLPLYTPISRTLHSTSRSPSLLYSLKQSYGNFCQCAPLSCLVSEVGGEGVIFCCLKSLLLWSKTQFDTFRPLPESGFGTVLYAVIRVWQRYCMDYLPPRRDSYILETTRFFISKCALTRGWDDYRFGHQGTVVHEQLTSLAGVHLFHCSPQSLKNALTLRTFKTRLLLLKSI